MLWGIFALAVLALLCLPLGIRLRFDEGGTVFRILVGPIPIALPAGKKKAEKKEKPKKPKKQKKKPAAAEPEPEPKEKPKQSILDWLPLVDVALDLLGSLRRKLRAQVLEVQVVLAGGDPATLALNYERACAAVCALEPQLERFLRCKRKRIDIGCDFLRPQTLVRARLELTITVGRLLSLLAVFGFRGLREFIKIKRNSNLIQQKGSVAA